MRAYLVPLLSLGFLAAAGVTAASAQTTPGGPDGPIATGPAEVSASIAAAAPRSAGSGEVIGMSEPRQETTTMAAAKAQTQALSPAAEIDPAGERDKMIELGPSTSFGIRKVEASEPLGSFLRANPHLNRGNRKQVGLSLRF